MGPRGRTGVLSGSQGKDRGPEGITEEEVGSPEGPLRQDWGPLRVPGLVKVSWDRTRSYGAPWAGPRVPEGSLGQDWGPEEAPRPGPGSREGPRHRTKLPQDPLGQDGDALRVPPGRSRVPWVP